MARKNDADSTPVETAPVETAPEVSQPVETAPVDGTPVQENASPEQPDESEQNEEALAAAFKSAVDDAIASRDETTGDIPLDKVEPVKAAYRELSGLKAKNAAKNVLTEGAFDAMRQMDTALGKAYVILSGEVTSLPTRTKAEPTPADPAEARVLQLATLGLAYRLATEQPLPEGVTQDSVDAKMNELFSLPGAQQESIDAYQQYLDTPSDARPEAAPEVPGFVAAAIKILNGKSVGRISRGSRSSSSYAGPRRSVAAHVEAAFAGKPVGTFLKVAEIVNSKSDEYGDDHPSSGAVSQHLFDKEGNGRTHGQISGTKSPEGERGAVISAA